MDVRLYKVDVRGTKVRNSYQVVIVIDPNSSHSMENAFERVFTFQTVCKVNELQFLHQVSTQLWYTSLIGILRFQDRACKSATQRRAKLDPKTTRPRVQKQKRAAR